MAQSNPGPFIVFIIFLFLIFSPGNPPADTIEQHDLRETVIAQEQVSLQLLRNSSFTDFRPNAGDDSKWLNLTGLRQKDDLQWALLPEAQGRARAALENVASEHGLDLLDGRTNGSLLMYRNVTGYLHGEWIQSTQGNRSKTVNLTEIVPGGYTEYDWGRNITGQEGKITLRLTERLPSRSYELDDRVRPINARLKIQDETSSGDGWDMILNGVHFSETGSVLLTTTSEKFAGVFAMPHFALSEHTFGPIQALLNKSATRTIQEQIDDSRNFDQNPWSSLIAEDFPLQPLCDFVVYLQQQPLGDEAPLNNSTALSLFDELEDLENDLRYPSGLYISNPPKLRMSMVAYSPDCGFIIESKGPPAFPANHAPHLEGPKIEMYVRQTKTVMVFFMIIFASQLLLLAHQMKASSTPSVRSRISYTTLSMLNMGSGFAAFGFLMLSSFVDSVFLDSMILAFLAFLDGNYIGMRFVLDVWLAQEPERLEALRVREQEIATAVANFNARLAARSAAATPATTPTPADSLPLPATAPQPQAPTQPGEATTTTTTPTPAPTQLTPPRLTPPQFGTLYARFSFSLLFLVFLSLAAQSSFPLPIRTAYTYLLTTTYLSAWLPQIHRNILRNTRKPLLWRFVVGQSFLRLAPVWYFWTVKGNVLDARPDTVGFAILVAWVVVQIVLLASQNVLGPRWFVSKSWKLVPETWEWRPELSEEDEEAGLVPVGGTVVVVGRDEEAGKGSKDEVGRRGSGSRGERSALVERTEKVERVYDCAICMQAVRVPVVSSTARTSSRPQTASHSSTERSTSWWSRLRERAVDGLKKIRMRKDGAATNTSGGMDEEDYAITPCRHVFHHQCIAGWLQYRSMCPICRSGLPGM